MKRAAKFLDLARRGMQSAAYGNPLYQKLLATGEAPRALRFTPPDPWPGDAQTGFALIAEQSHLFERPESAASDMTTAMRGLRAAGSDAARQMALQLIGEWLHRYDSWHEGEWAPAALGERIANWIGFYEFYAPAASPGFIEHLTNSLSRQFKHLARTLPTSLEGVEALQAIRGLVYGGLNFSESESALGFAFDLLRRRLQAEILPDGGHVSRNPAMHLHILRHLVDLREVLKMAGLEMPVEGRTAIASMVPALKFWLHGDGALALFQGGGEETPLAIEALLAQAAIRTRRSARLPNTGYERLMAGRSLLIVDTGSVPQRDFGRPPHAGLLSFEFGHGRERLIVNCGEPVNANAAWQAACASTAAHSTLAVEETNSCEVRPGAAAPRVVVQRYEQEGAAYIDMNHDGYRAKFGVMHSRLLALSTDGDELHGRDLLLGGPGRRFDVRWHLHPDIQASLAHGGQAALLRSASGTGWRLKVKGASLGIESSVYCGRGFPRRSLQLKAASCTQGDETAVTWSLAREKKN